ncbi:hypothetical protein D3C81_1763030 [compost metagenome]
MSYWGMKISSFFTFRPEKSADTTLFGRSSTRESATAAAIFCWASSSRFFPACCFSIAITFSAAPFLWSWSPVGRDLRARISSARRGLNFSTGTSRSLASTAANFAFSGFRPLK